MRDRIVRIAAVAAVAALVAVFAGEARAVGIHSASPYARALTTVPGTGRTFTSVSFSWMEADAFYVGKSQVDFNTTAPFAGSRRLTMRSGSVYHEYGLSDLSAVSISIPYVVADNVIWNGVVQPQQESVGDITARYRHLFNTGGLDLALALGVKAPGGADPLRLNAFTKGQTDLFLEGGASTAMANGIFAEVSAGYRWRLGDPDNDLTLGGELGWKSPFGLEGVTPRAFYDVTYANGGLEIGGTGWNAATSATGLPATREIRRIAGGAITYDYKSFLFGVSYAQSHAGRNTDAGRTVTVSAGMRY